MRKILLIFLIFIGTICSAQINDISLKITGLSDEYASKFRSEKQEIIDQINDIGFPNSVSPVDVEVSYIDGEGWVTMTVHYVHDDFFTKYSKYSKHNDSWRGMGKGISFIFVDQLLKVLSVYKYSVATEGFSIDKDLAKFRSCIKLENDNNYIQIYAYNYLGGSYGKGAYPHNFYKNVHIKYENEYLELVTANPETLNKMKFFYIGKTTGLDGKPTGGYYFSKFFKIDEWESPAQRAEKRKIKEELERKEREKQLQKDFEDKVKNSTGYIYSSKLSNEKELCLDINPKAAFILYEYILDFKKEYTDGYNYKIENYNNNLEWASKRGNKKEDYAMFDFNMCFDKTGKLENIENSGVLIKGVGLKDINLPKNVFSKLEEYFSLNTGASVNLEGVEYPVKSSFMLFFTFAESTSDTLIYFKKSKKGELEFETETPDVIKEFLINNSKILELEKGKYEIKLGIEKLDCRLSHFQYFNQNKKITDSKDTLSILNVKRL